MTIATIISDGYIVPSPFDLPCEPLEGQLLVLLPKKLDSKGEIVLAGTSSTEYYEKLTVTVLKVSENFPDKSIKVGDELMIKRLYQDGKMTYYLEGGFAWMKWDMEAKPKKLMYNYQIGVIHRNSILAKFDKNTNTKDFI